MPLEIDWEGLVVGFESRSHKITHFFDRQSGEVIQVLTSDAGRHAAFETDPRFLALPRDQGERSRGDLEDFASHCDDAECRRALLATLQSADPPSEYRRVLLKYPKEEAHFFQFKERRARERAIEWLRENGIAK